jgi:hypothetical protein
MPQYRVFKPTTVDHLTAEQVVPIQPPPLFRSNTSHVRVVQGGFMDDQQRWHPAPKRIKEAIRVNGRWYWVCNIRDRKGRMILSKALLYPMMQD